MIFENQKDSSKENPNEKIFDINSERVSDENKDYSEYEEIKNEYILFPNYPNPFDYHTIINYQIPSLSKVKILILDVFGREVFNLLNEKLLHKGIHQVTWNASEYSNGTYLLFMKATSLHNNQEYNSVQKMILNK